MLLNKDDALDMSALRSMSETKLSLAIQLLTEVSNEGIPHFLVTRDDRLNLMKIISELENIRSTKFTLVQIVIAE